MSHQDQTYVVDEIIATSWTVAQQAPPFMGFSRQEYWSGLPFSSPGDLPNPGIEPTSPALQADALTSEPPGRQQMKSLKECLQRREDNLRLRLEALQYLNDRQRRSTQQNSRWSTEEESSMVLWEPGVNSVLWGSDQLCDEKVKEDEQRSVHQVWQDNYM